MKKNAFTVIELITVIAIVAILMAVLTPAVSNMLASARRSSDANNLRQLAMSYISYINEAGATRSVSFTSLNDWAVALAQSGNFNEPELFLSQSDPMLPSTLPEKVHTNGTIDTVFASCALSVAAPQSVNLNASASSTPIAWTRGLNMTSGTWSSNSPYGTKGGYIAFLDGHVSFYNKVDTDRVALPSADAVMQRTGEVAAN